MADPQAGNRRSRRPGSRGRIDGGYEPSLPAPLAGIEVATLVGVIAALAAGYFVSDTRLVEK